MAALNEIGMLLVSLATIAAGFVLGIWFSLWLADRAVGRRDRREALGIVRHEPCWSEALGRDGKRSFERSECVNDVLMAMDARAARGDFPIPRQY